jgi:hypothetical protein
MFLKQKFMLLLPQQSILLQIFDDKIILELASWPAWSRTVVQFLGISELPDLGIRHLTS